MASAANAGTLYIDLVTNLSRLQDEMNQIQRSVGKMSDASGRYIGAVNDNFTRMGTKVTEVQAMVERMSGVTGGAMARNQADFDAYGAALDKMRAKYNPLFATINAYKLALADIRKAHAVGAISADEMAAAISRERQASLASIAAVKGPGAAAQQKAEADAYAASLEKLRAQYNPLFAAIQSYKQALSGVRQAHAMGAISADEMAAAITRERQASLASIAAIKGPGAAAQQKAEADAYAASLDRLRAKYNPLFATINAYKLALADIRKAHAVGAISADEMAAAISRERQASLASIAAIKGQNVAQNDLNATATLGKHHVQNLVYQFQDLGVQLAAAAGSSAPLKMTLMALFQQGSQIQGVMSQAGIGVKGLVAQMLALAAPLAPIAIGLGVVAAAIGVMTSEINANSKVHVTWADTALGAYDALKYYLEKELTKAMSAFGVTSTDVWSKVVQFTKTSINVMIGSSLALPVALYSVLDRIPPAFADAFYSAANLAIDSVNWLVSKAASGVNTLVDVFNAVFDTSIEPVLTHSIDRIANPFAGAMRNLAKTGMQSFSSTLHFDYLGAAASAISPFAQARAVARMKKDAKDAGKATGEAARKAVEDEMAKLMNEISKASEAFGAAIGKTVGDKLNADFDAMHASLSAGMSDWAKAAVDNAKANAAWNDQLTETIRMVDQLGEAGRSLGNIGAMFQALHTGNWSPVTGPMGVLGKALGGVTFSSTDKNGDRQIRTLGDVFDGALGKVFGREGSFTKTLQSAGVGMAAGQMFLGSNNSNIGSAIGGAVGEKAGEALTKGMSGLLGQMGGPLGSIVGGLIGGALGSLLQSTPSGSGKVTNTGVTTSANNDSIKAGLDSFGLGLQQTIRKIADQLGGTVGAYDVGIGRYKDYYQVSSVSNDLALGHKNYNQRSASALYDGQDPEAAMRAAISAAIADGAIQGVRAGTQALLKAGNDIEQQLTKAMKFEGVFNELKSMTDPLGYSLDNLTKQFDDLRTIFKEAGATTADYAQLEQLLALKRADAIAKAEDQIRQDAVGKVSDKLNLQIKILELLGKTEDSVAATRLLELAGMKGSLQPLQAMVYQLEDANAIIAKFGPLANDLKAFRDELLGNGAGTGFAFLAQQFRSTAALAAGGDATAMGSLRGASNAYLQAAKDNAGSQLEYQRAVSEVLASVDRGIFAADTQVDYAQAQIDAIKNSAAIMQAMREELKTLTAQVADTSAQTLRLWQRFDADGLTVKADADTPLPVTVVE